MNMNDTHGQACTGGGTELIIGEGDTNEERIANARRWKMIRTPCATPSATPSVDIARPGSGVKDVEFYRDTIVFTDDHAGSSLCGKRLHLDKETRKLVRLDTGEVISEEVPGGECDVLFGDGWKGRVKIVEAPETVAPAKKDMVNKPAHYRRYGVETIDALRGTMSPEEFNGFLKGNAFKYLTRCGAKDSLEQDLHKVCWYTMFLYLANGGTVESLGETYEYMTERFAK